VLQTWLLPAALCYLPTVGDGHSRGTEDLPGPGMLCFTIQHLSVALGGMPGLELGEALARGLFCRVWDMARKPPCGAAGETAWGSCV